PDHVPDLWDPRRDRVRPRSGRPWRWPRPAGADWEQPDARPARRTGQSGRDGRPGRPMVVRRHPTGGGAGLPRSVRPGLLRRGGRAVRCVCGSAPAALPEGGPMTSPSTSSVDIASVSKWYGNVVAVNDITMSLGAGVTGLLGPNGAGKTTVL